jgi:parallel beta-helix repeat protein
MQIKGSMKVCPYCQWEETTSPGTHLHLPPRTILSNQYLIGRVISEGKFSLTYLGYDLKTRQKLAIKEYLPDDIARRAEGQFHIAVTDSKHENDFNFGLGKFIEESMALETQKHLPGLAHTSAIFRENGTAYRIMDYIEGPDLEEYLEAKGGRIPFHQLVRLITPVLIGLERVYEKHLLHYDICPQNIIVGNDGVGRLVNFTATRFELSQSWKNIASVSRPGYSPVEFYIEDSEIGPWSDVYSLAVTIYHALTGQIPPEAPKRRIADSLAPPSKLDTDITTETEKILLKALAVKPEDRYQFVKAFKESILESWYTRERKKPSIALDAFTRVRCPYCGAINEALKTDLETGTTACFACHHPLVVEGFEKPAGLPGSEEKTTEAPPSRHVPKKKIRKARPASARAAFTQVTCSDCGTTNEVLISDLGTVALCTKCSAHLPAEPDISPAPGISTEEPHTVETEETPLFSMEETAAEEVTSEELQLAKEESPPPVEEEAAEDMEEAPPDEVTTTDIQPVEEPIEEEAAEDMEEALPDEVTTTDIQPVEEFTEKELPYPTEEETAEDENEDIEIIDSSAIEEKRELKQTFEDESSQDRVEDIQIPGTEERSLYEDDSSEDPETETTSAAEPEIVPESPEEEGETAEEEYLSDEDEGAESLAAIKAIFHREEEWHIEEEEKEAPPAERDTGVPDVETKKEAAAEESDVVPEKAIKKPADKDPLTPLDCPVCKTRNYFKIDEILAGVRCQKCNHHFFTETPEKEVKEALRPSLKELLTRRRSRERRRVGVWTISIIAVLFIIGAVSIFWFQQDNDSSEATFEEYLSSGDRFFKQKDYSAAISNYQSALNYKPNDLYIKAQISLSDSLLAEQQIMEADKKQRELIITQLYLADSLFAAGNYSEAKLAYENALAISPDEPYILNRLGEIQKMLNASPSQKASKKVLPKSIVRPRENLQQRIDRAAPNSVVQLTAGIYSIPNPLVIRKHIELKGAGPNHTLIVSNAGESVIDINGLVEFKASGIGFEYQGEKWSDLLRIKDAKVTINNCLFRGAVYQEQSRRGGNGILFEGSSRGSVRSSRFHKNHIGINVRQISKPTISGNEIWNNHVGVQISETAGPIVTGNRVRENFNNGVAVLDQAQPVIESNQINENRANGLFFYSSKFSGNIRNNQIFRNRDMGILLANQSQPTMEDNKIKWNGLGGVQFNDKSSGIMRNNEIQNNKHGGIKITNTARPTIKTNRIKNNQGDGIEIMDKATPTVDGNEISQNNGDGISLLLSAPGGYISNNICKGNQGYGISILKSARPALVNNKLQGNFEGNLYEEFVEIQ